MEGEPKFEEEQKEEQGFEDKKEAEKEYKYDAIVTLNGGIREHRGIWRTTNYSEGDDYGTLGARVRMIATEYMHEAGNIAENFLVATGKKEVEKKELLKRGLPEESIYIENKAKNTRQNIENILQIVKKHNWKRILIISNKYHIPRIKVLYEKFLSENEEYKDFELNFSGAEDVLIGANPKWEKYIDQAYSTEGMQKRILNEEKGLRDLEKDTYKSVQDK